MNKVIKSILMFGILSLRSYALTHVILPQGGFHSEDAQLWGRDVDGKELPTGSLEKTLDSNVAIQSHNPKIYYDIPINTTERTIDEQAQDLKIALDLKLTEDGVAIDEEVELIIVAHSQGGLRAWSFNKHFGKHITGSRYHVTGIFTAGTPWQGATIINSRDYISLYLSDLAGNASELIETFAGRIFKVILNKIDMIGKVNSIVGSQFASHVLLTGSSQMIPGSSFLTEVNSEHEDYSTITPVSVTKYGCVAGYQGSLWEAWLKDQKRNIQLLTTTFSAAMGPMIVSSKDPAKMARGQAQLAHVKNLLNPDTMDALVDTAITETPHDCLISTTKQVPHPNIMKSIPGVEGQWIDGTEEESTYKVNCAHGVITKYDHTSSETKNPDVFAQIAKWINKVQGDI